MKNFLRALKFAWPYRYRLLCSVFCALLAAVLWALTFTSISPTLTILADRQNLQEWAHGRVVQTEKEIIALKARRDAPVKEQDDLWQKPPDPGRDKKLRNLTLMISGLESELEAANLELYFYQAVEWHSSRYLPRDPFQTLACVIGLVIVGVAIRGVFEFFQESLVGSVVNLSLYDLRNRLYRNAIHLDMNQFTAEGTHELMARFTNDMEILGAGVKTLFGRVIAEPLKVVMCVAVACWFSWQLTLMFLILVPVAVFIMTKVGRLMKQATRRLLERMANLYKILQESFQGIRVVKAFTMEPHERARFRSATRDYYHKAMWVVNLDALASPIIELLGVMAIALALLAGAYLVLSSSDNMLFGIKMTDRPLTWGALLQLYGLLASIADPVRKLSSVYTRIQSGSAAADRIFDFMDRRPKVQSNSGKARLAPHQESIEFREVCFSYEPGEPVLSSISFDVRHGETIALVGKNGCGKTTLLGLVPRFFDPDHGSVRIDGVDIRHVHLRSLREQIGLVTQETALFDGTVWENIAYGNRKAPREHVEEAATRAYAHEFILKLPQAYDTRLGEAGSRLSGGQKQRIALARAFLRKPRILILDEFTSQTDIESEILIHKALMEFMKGRTTFVITHRLNTLEIANRIVIIEAGRVVAVGTHAELLRACPAYQRLQEAKHQRLSA